MVTTNFFSHKSANGLSLELEAIITIPNLKLLLSSKIVWHGCESFEEND